MRTSIQDQLLAQRGRRCRLDRLIIALSSLNTYNLKNYLRMSRSKNLNKMNLEK